MVLFLLFFKVDVCMDYLEQFYQEIGLGEIQVFFFVWDQFFLDVQGFIL